VWFVVLEFSFCFVCVFNLLGQIKNIWNSRYILGMV
jgi:hypothetical protein